MVELHIGSGAWPDAAKGSSRVGLARSAVPSRPQPNLSWNRQTSYKQRNRTCTSSSTTPRTSTTTSTLSLSALSCLSLLRSARVQLTRLGPTISPSTSLLRPHPTRLATRFASAVASSSATRSPTLPAYTSKNLPRAARPSAPPSPAHSPIPDHSMQVDLGTASASSANCKSGSSSRHAIPQQFGDFSLVATGELEFAAISVSKWVSAKTGLKVVYADVESPLVQAYMPIVTEIFDDTGRPHTLEHLVSRGLAFPARGGGRAPADDSQPACRFSWEVRSILTREFVR